jgi:hypothetical protein
MITPTTLNRYLKRVNYMVNIQEDYAEAAHAIDSYTVIDQYDLSYFTKKQVEDFVGIFQLVQLFLYVDIKDDSLVELKKIRVVLDKIFVKELWFAERLMKDNMTNDDVGDFLGELPDLVRFEIRGLLYTML